MTEKQHWKSNNLCLIEETTGVSLYGTVCTDMDFIAKQLNDKIDTIERLRKENEELKKDLFEAFNQSKYITVQKTVIFDLKKENEELKKELVEFKKWEKHIGDVKMEELDRVFKMSIYEIAEAFDYYKERIEKLERS
ncbi:hypothetical protein [uncultured Methanobrevibacter sp.]|uniref:hypothetical protein n=1 Tax=uncultured Methanobrevibacter sp. TaxID=253161 RepID=UPI0025F0FE6D|nr:hypothetical protein [uncultured Methanobrevibacter sp.]